MWTIAAGEEWVIEFQSEEILYCGNYCYAFAAVERPDEIFVSPYNADTLARYREQQINFPPDSKVYVLNLKSKTVSLMAIERFVQLEFMAEALPVDTFSDHPELKCGGNQEGHQYLAPIQKIGKTFVATLSSVKKSSEKTTFGMPGIIPFMGREKWVQKETSHSGTFFLEIFDKERPLKPIVQLQKEFSELWLLPSIFEMASWTQGAEEPILVVVDNDYRTKKIKGRVLLIRPK